MDLSVMQNIILQLIRYFTVFTRKSIKALESLRVKF